MWHQISQPTPIQEHRPEIPKKLSAVIEKMLAKDPAMRYQVPAEVIDALEPWDEGIQLPPDHEMPMLSPAAMGASTGRLPPIQKLPTSKMVPPVRVPLASPQLAILLRNPRIRAAAILGALTLAGLAGVAAAVLAAH